MDNALGNVGQDDRSNVSRDEYDQLLLEITRLKRDMHVMKIEKEIMHHLKTEPDETAPKTSTPKYVHFDIPKGRFDPASLEDQGLDERYSGPPKLLHYDDLSASGFENPLSAGQNDALKKSDGDTEPKMNTDRTYVKEDSQITATPSTYASSKGTIMKPATYDGSSSWTNYKAHFEACAALNSWDDHQKGLYLSVSLRGQAQGVFGNLRSGTTDYGELSRALEDRFSPSNQTELYRVQMRDRHQRATETMAELGQDIRRLTNLAYPTAPNDVRETLAKEQFMDALSNSDMRLKIKQARPVDLNDAVRHAVELEAFYKAEKRQQGMVRTTESKDGDGIKELIQDLRKRMQGMERRLDHQQQQSSRRQFEGMGNRNYKRWDNSGSYKKKHASKAHATAQVDNKQANQNVRKCYKCGSEEHLQRSCPNMKKPSEDDEYGNRQRPSINQTGVKTTGLYASAEIDGVQVDCLVDTGATLTVISSQIWKMIQDKCILSPFSREIISATGDAMKVLGQAEITLKFGKAYCPVRVIVAEIDLDVVLGLDIMKNHEISIDVINNAIVIKGQKLDLSCTGKLGCYRVVLTEKIDIPAQSEMVLSGKVDGVGANHLGLGIVEPTEYFSENGKSLVARSLVKANEFVPVRIANFSDECQTVYPGTNVATISAVQNVSSCMKESRPLNTEKRIPEHIRDLYERASDGTTGQQRAQIRRLLLKYSHIFSSTDSDLGRTGIITHQIPTGNARPIKQPLRRVPVHLRDEVDKQIDKMLEDDVIEPSTSPWASGIVLVKKKDGTRRFCVDYRRLNNVTIKDAYPLPRVDESLDHLSGSTWFSSLDLSSGYWQVEMDEHDKGKTAFATHKGLFQFKVMPFGLCNAPATFERLMESVLAGLHWNICLIYLDDIIVISKTFEEMIKNLETVFKRFEDVDLKLKPRKCHLFRKEVEFLGHIINESGVGTDPKKIECIKNWPTPQSITEVRSFLGLCSYYRRFIHKYSEIAKPLTRLNEKGVKFLWTEDCEKAFSTLKHRLTTAPILRHPDFSKQFTLDTDASDNAIGAVLSQEVGGEEKVIAYASRTLTKTERKYCVTRKEMLAVVFFVKYFRHYLCGRKFHLRTDHGSLRWLMNFKNPEGQVARWLEILSAYEMDIEHRAGNKHKNADGCSRIPCRQCGRNDQVQENVSQAGKIANISEVVSSEDSMETLQQNDENLSKVIQWLKAGKKPLFKEIESAGYALKSLWNQFDRLELNDNILTRRWDNFETKEITYQTVLPYSQRRAVLACAHDIKPAGHLGVQKTLMKIRQNFYWPGLQGDVRAYVSGCETCMKRKGPARTKQAPMQVVRSGYPMERIAIDILGELPETDDGNRYILVIADYFTKWTECFPMRNMESETVARILVEEVVARFGIPSKIHSDQGRQFEGKLFQEMCGLLGIDKTRRTPYHPQSDGMVERFNRTLTTMLSAYVNEHHKDWDRQIPYVMMAYRSAEHETTGMSPNKVMLGREVSTPLDLMYELPSNSRHIPINEWVWELQERLATAHSIVRQNTGQSIIRQKQVHDRKNSFETFENGDKVLVYFPVKKVGTSSKFTSYWRGPYEIVGKLSPVLYKVNCGRNKTIQVIHCDRIRKCKDQTLRGEPDSYDNDDDAKIGSKVDNETGQDRPDDIFINDNDDTDFMNQDASLGNDNAEIFDTRSKRKRSKPVWAKDYVFYFRQKMAKTKVTQRKDQIPALICSICKDKFPEEGKWKEHLAACVLQDKERRTCKVHGIVFGKHAYYTKHMKLQHAGEEASAIKEKSCSRQETAEDDSWMENDPDIRLDYEASVRDENSDKIKETESMDVAKLLEGRTVRKATAPVLPGKRMSADDRKQIHAGECMKSNTETVPVKVTQQDKQPPVKKPADAKKASLSSREANKKLVQVQEQISSTDESSESESENEQRKVKITFRHEQGVKTKRQRLSIEENEETSYESSLACPVNKQMTPVKLNLGDYVSAGNIKPSEVQLEVSQDGEITIDFTVQ